MLTIAAIAVVAGTARWSPLAAQSAQSGGADTSLALSVGVRSWSRRSRTGRRPGGGFAAPNKIFVAAGLASMQMPQLSIAPGPDTVRRRCPTDSFHVGHHSGAHAGNAGADVRLEPGKRRVRSGPRHGRSKARRCAHGTAASLVVCGGARWRRCASPDWHATPTSNDMQLGGWFTRGATQFSASLQRTATGRLAAVGADSGSIDPASCHLDYDPNRPLQQYLTVCPQHLQSTRRRRCSRLGHSQPSRPSLRGAPDGGQYGLRRADRELGRRER